MTNPYTVACRQCGGQAYLNISANVYRCDLCRITMPRAAVENRAPSSAVPSTTTIRTEGFYACPACYRDGTVSELRPDVNSHIFTCGRCTAYMNAYDVQRDGVPRIRLVGSAPAPVQPELQAIAKSAAPVTITFNSDEIAVLLQLLSSAPRFTRENDVARNALYNKLRDARSAAPVLPEHTPYTSTKFNLRRLRK